MTEVEYFENMYLFYINLEYMLRRYLNFNNIRVDITECFELLKRYKDDTDNKDIFNMQIHGIDHMKIPYYKNKFETNRTKQKKEKLDPEEAKQYKDVFGGILERIKDHG